MNEVTLYFIYVFCAIHNLKFIIIIKYGSSARGKGKLLHWGELDVIKEHEHNKYMFEIVNAAGIIQLNLRTIRKIADNIKGMS
jgi:hypothetical protein